MKKWRSKKYIDFVKSLPCVITGMDAEAPHHLIGHDQGGTSIKSSDLFAFPLTTHFHVGDEGIHKIGTKKWESLHGCQWSFVVHVINLAIDDGVIDLEFAREEINRNVRNIDHIEYLTNGLNL